MKQIRKEIEIKSNVTFEFVKITEDVQKVIDETGVREGLLLVKSPHTTAAVVITEDDSDLHQDTKMVLENLLSLELPWKHVDEGKVNARAHQAALLLGNSVLAPISGGQISLGTWQDIFFVECLEGRRRRVEVVVIGENTQGVNSNTP